MGKQIIQSELSAEGHIILHSFVYWGGGTSSDFVAGEVHHLAMHHTGIDDMLG